MHMHACPADSQVKPYLNDARQAVELGDKLGRGGGVEVGDRRSLFVAGRHEKGVDQRSRIAQGLRRVEIW